MLTITLQCSHCQSDALIRDGHAPNGKQKYRCHTCGRRSRENPTPTGTLLTREIPPSCYFCEGRRHLPCSHLRTHRLIALKREKFPRQQSTVIAVVRKIEPAASRSKDKRSASLWLNTSLCTFA